MGHAQGSLENVGLSFWRNKRVLITGHTGFKGSWLVLWLQALGAQVNGYALAPPSQPNLFADARVAGGMVASTLADIRDAGRVEQALLESQPEVLIHMAAQPLVRRSYQDPIETYATNVMGTVHVLEAARRNRSLRVVVIVTSDKCYENREWVWSYRENDRLGGYDPYSNSKGCAEMATAAFRSSFFHPARYADHGVAVASARAGNVIGGGDWAEDRLIPDLVRAFRVGQAALIRNPAAVRPWQHVLEPLSGYLQLAERLWNAGPAFAQAWNFGPAGDDLRPVGWIADQAAALWGGGARWTRDGSEVPHEAQMLRLDSSKAISMLGWTPRWSLEEALAATMDWYKRQQQGQDMRTATLEQIKCYEGCQAKPVASKQ